MTFPLWPFAAQLHFGRTPLGLVCIVFVWRWQGAWRHRAARLS